MGRKGAWFSAVKKALSPDSREKKDKVHNLCLNFNLFNLLLNVLVTRIGSLLFFSEISKIEEKMVWQKQHSGSGFFS